MKSSDGIRLVRRGESLRSIQHKGVRIRTLYENEWVEISTTELEPENSIGGSDLWGFAAIHFVVQGSLLLHGLSRSILLLAGDSVSLPGGKEYRISNPALSPCVIWSLRLKTLRPETNGGGS